jgi:hypothetical protein
MTREELDTLWDKSVNESIKAGDSYARYRYAEYVAKAALAEPEHIHTCGPDCQKPLCVNRRREIAEAVEAEREACKQIAKEQAAQYKVGGALQMVMEKYSAQAAASACGHIAHLIEQRGGANDR